LNITKDIKFVEREVVKVNGVEMDLQTLRVLLGFIENSWTTSPEVLYLKELKVLANSEHNRETVPGPNFWQFCIDTGLINGPACPYCGNYGNDYAFPSHMYAGEVICNVCYSDETCVVEDNGG